MDSAPPRSLRLLKENLSVKCGAPPYELLTTDAPGAPTTQTVAVAPGCQPWMVRLLQEHQHTLVAIHRELNLELTRKLLP